MPNRAEMHIGNPASCWISGSEKVSFTYEPGKAPWICQYRGGRWVAMTAMVFADDEAHARKIIADLLDFVEKHHNGEYRCCLHDDKVRLLKEVRAMDLKVCRADRSQVYRVEWASNGQFSFC